MSVLVQQHSIIKICFLVYHRVILSAKLKNGWTIKTHQLAREVGTCKNTLLISVYEVTNYLRNL